MRTMFLQILLILFPSAAGGSTGLADTQQIHTHTNIHVNVYTVHAQTDCRNTGTIYTGKNPKNKGRKKDKSV